MIKPLLRATTSLLLILANVPAQANGPVFYPASANAPFSKAVRVDNTVYLSGIIGAASDGKLAADFDSQITQLMDNLKMTVTSLDLSMDQVFKCTVMIDDMAKWQAFNHIYTGYFSPKRMPARSAFGSDGLALGAQAELECLVYWREEE